MVPSSPMVFAFHHITSYCITWLCIVKKGNRVVEQLAVVAIEDLCPIEDTGVLLVVGEPVAQNRFWVILLFAFQLH